MPRRAPFHTGHIAIAAAVCAAVGLLLPDGYRVAGIVQDNFGFMAVFGGREGNAGGVFPAVRQALHGGIHHHGQKR
jgi:hypothetical protein